MTICLRCGVVPNFAVTSVRKNSMTNSKDIITWEGRDKKEEHINLV